MENVVGFWLLRQEGKSRPGMLLSLREVEVDLPILRVFEVKPTERYVDAISFLMFFLNATHDEALRMWATMQAACVWLVARPAFVYMQDTVCMHGNQHLLMYQGGGVAAEICLRLRVSNVIVFDSMSNVTQAVYSSKFQVPVVAEGDEIDLVWHTMRQFLDNELSPHKCTKHRKLNRALEDLLLQKGASVQVVPLPRDLLMVQNRDTGERHVQAVSLLKEITRQPCDRLRKFWTAYVKKAGVHLKQSMICVDTPDECDESFLTKRGALELLAKFKPHEYGYRKQFVAGLLEKYLP